MHFDWHSQNLFLVGPLSLFQDMRYSLEGSGFKKRGRKRKLDKLLEAAAQNNAAMQAAIQASQNALAAARAQTSWSTSQLMGKLIHYDGNDTLLL